MEYVLWKNALRAFFHNTYSLFGAAKPREHPPREGEAAEYQTHSKKPHLAGGEGFLYAIPD